MEKQSKNFLKKNMYLLAFWCRYCYRKDLFDLVQKYFFPPQPSGLTYYHFGDRNNDKLICLINFMGGSGFFDPYRRMLEYIYIAEKLHAVPVVNWTNGFSYYEGKLPNGINNGFEYYFEQISDVSVDEAYLSANVIVPVYENRMLAFDNFIHESRYFSDIKTKYFYKEEYDPYMNYFSNEPDSEEKLQEYFGMLASIQKKYIKIRKEIMTSIEKEMKNLLQDKKTLAVHARGTDYKKGYKLCPVYVSPQEHLKEAKRLLNEHKFEQIFLATDNEETRQLFVNAFGSKLLYYEDTFRASEDNDEALQFSTADRKLHKFRLGYEVMRDMLTMAECNGLVAGISGVNMVAQITKIAREEKYEYIKIFNNGQY